MEEIEYFGLGAQDEKLKSEVEDLVAAHNAKAIGKALAYGPYLEDEEDEEEDYSYWGVHTEGDPSDLLMFVVYDDQSSVAFSPGSAEADLFNGVLDAMQSYMTREGFSDSVRMGEEDA